MKRLTALACSLMAFASIWCRIDTTEETNDAATQASLGNDFISVITETEVAYAETTFDTINKATTYKSKVETIKYNVPDYDTYFKSYMSYKAITNRQSPQYKLQQKAWTDEFGLRRVNNDYMVAMGTFYSKTIGDRFKITLQNGNEFTVIIGDIKADVHTNDTNQYSTVCNESGKTVSVNILEFIVDTDCLPKRVRQLGSVSGIDQFKGNIKSIEKIVEDDD